MNGLSWSICSLLFTVGGEGLEAIIARTSVIVDSCMRSLQNGHTCGMGIRLVCVSTKWLPHDMFHMQSIHIKLEHSRLPHDKVPLWVWHTRQRSSPSMRIGISSSSDRSSSESTMSEFDCNSFPSEYLQLQVIPLAYGILHCYVPLEERMMHRRRKGI